MTKRESTSTRTSPASFDLGDREARDRRMRNLDALAKRFGLTRSVLLQKIADGEITVIAKPEGVSGDVFLEQTYDFAPGALDEMQAAIDESFE
jgi:hypothetical protein